MKVLALTIIICLEILHGQKVTRPDPPPGYNNKNPSRPDLGQAEGTTGSRGSVCSTKSCLKWVYCVNTSMWKLVNQTTVLLSSTITTSPTTRPSAAILVTFLITTTDPRFGILLGARNRRHSGISVPSCQAASA